jgi:hypothetical protein
MKSIISTLLIIVAVASVAQAKVDLVTLPKRETVQLTIYNSADMTLVRESRDLTLKNGKNKLQFSWANTLIDPTSLEMLPKANADKIDIADLTYPPRVRNLGLWNIKSGVSGKVPVEITYLTSGLSWRAFYMGTLTEDEKTMRLQGYVRVTNNSGEDYENAQTRLIVGKVHILDRIADLARRQYPYGRPGEVRRIVGAGDRWGRLAKDEMERTVTEYLVVKVPEKPKEIKKEGLSEYFLYTIEGTETIPTGWSKRLLSFDVDEVPVVNLYKYEQERYGNSVVRFLSFKNDKEHKLGETPIPGGMLKAYRSVDKLQHLSYVGQSAFKYIPVDEDVELNLGPVGNVVVEPTLMDYKTDNHRFDFRGNVSGWDEIRKFRIKVKNTREVPVKVEIQRNFNSSYWDLEKSGNFDEFEKVDFDTVRFTVKLEPLSKKEFSYVLTTYHGVRQERGINGWSETVKTAYRNPYTSFLGDINMVLARQTRGQNLLIWKTAPVPKDIDRSKNYTFKWIAGLGMVDGTPGKFTLMLKKKKLVDFHAVYRDARWESSDGKISLRYIQRQLVGPGSSGVMELSLPASLLKPGQKAELRVVGSKARNIRWAGVYEIQ